MTKTVRVISIFITTLLLVFSVAKISYALNLIKPSITFGDLLNTTANLNEQQAAIDAKKQRIKELLDRLESFYNAPQTDNLTMKKFNSYLSPSPYIPLPTLMAGITEIVSNQQSVLGIQKSAVANQNSNSYNQSPEAANYQLPITLSPQPTIPPFLSVNNQQSTNNAGNLNENPFKSTYVLALLGDSMTDTLGRDLPHLRQLLNENYPQLSFALLNYGQGSTDLDSGLYRLTNTTKYLDNYFPPLLSFKPDILVVESFAYNHWSGEKYDLDRQWLAFAKIIDIVKAYSPDTKIVLAASIAPNYEFFGDGKLNWPKELKWESAMTTKAYLQNLVNFALSEKYPLADAYHASMDNSGNGIRLYINQGDNLHPSNEGALLFSKKIIEAIKENNLIK